MGSFGFATTAAIKEKVSTMTNKHNRSADQISVERLREAVHYEAATGVLTWLKRPVEHFKNLRAANVWNARYSGKPAFDTIMANGYRKGCFDYIELLAHRVAWALMTGKFPEGDVDHINGLRSENKARNLRECSRAQNLQNQRFRGNKAGVMGVYLHKASGLYHARIDVCRKAISLGYFRDLGDAQNARLAAERQYGFHSNHGRAA